MSWVNYDSKVPWHGRYNATKRPEEAEQIKVIGWVRRQPPSIQKDLRGLLHIPNQRGGRSQAENMALSAMGVRPGTFDLFLPFPVTGGPGLTFQTFHGLWIEMKAIRGRNHPDKPGQMQVEVGKVSPEQKEFAALMLERGYAVHIAWWEESAQNALRQYVCGNWVQPPLEELLRGYER